MDIKQYSAEVIAAIESMSEEEFERLLLESGIENCPYENNEYANRFEIALPAEVLQGKYIIKKSIYFYDNKYNFFDYEMVA